MEDPAPVVVNVEDVAEQEYAHGDHFGQFYKPLTPALERRPGSLGVSLTRLPPGHVGCPFHYHQLEDEVFFVLSGTGVLRYGEDLQPLRTGDCISCPAGTRIAHQIANTGTEDLVYLAAGRNDPNEVAVYPDTGKVLVRSLKRVGYLADADYHDGEPEPPRILELARNQQTGG